MILKSDPVVLPAHQPRQLDHPGPKSTWGAMPGLWGRPLGAGHFSTHIENHRSCGPFAPNLCGRAAWVSCWSRGPVRTLKGPTGPGEAVKPPSPVPQRLLLGSRPPAKVVCSVGRGIPCTEILGARSTQGVKWGQYMQKKGWRRMQRQFLQ